MKLRFEVSAFAMIALAILSAPAMSADEKQTAATQTAQAPTDKMDTTPKVKAKKKAKPHSHSEWKYGTPDNRSQDTQDGTSSGESHKPLHDHSKFHK